MYRTRNTDSQGNQFLDPITEAVWQKGALVGGTGFSDRVGAGGTALEEIRKDVCGASMKKGHYGVTASKMGWEIDHIQPVAKDGTDDLSNLQPLQWQNNRHKADNYPQWSCKVSA